MNDEKLQNYQIKRITLVEIPGQNLLEMRPISLTRLIWGDMDLNTRENLQYRGILNKQFGAQGFSTAETIEELTTLVHQTVRSVILISGRFAKAVIPYMHHLKHIRSIVIFCMKVDRYVEWAKDYKKVILITDVFKVALRKCQ